jgi:hypothetical protein
LFLLALFVYSCTGVPEQIPDLRLTPAGSPELPAQDDSTDSIQDEIQTLPPPVENVETREPEPAETEEPELELVPEIRPEPESRLEPEPYLESLPEPGIPENEESPPDEKAEVLLLPDISGADSEELLPEPSLDFAEILVEPLPPQEEAFGSVLPEPLAPYFPELPEEDLQIAEVPAGPPILPEPIPASPSVVPESVIPSPPAAPPVVPSATPAAPLFVRPAEEDTPLPVRESVVQPVLPESPVYTPPEIREPGINFSRVVRATVGQLVEVPFRGTGWVYLGELGARPGIVYSSRRLDPDGQSFVFRVETSGTYGLRFYKQDFIQDYILNDYVQVIAGEPPEAAAMGWFNPAIDRGRVVAEPRWPSALEEAEIIGREFGAGSNAQGPAATPGSGSNAQGPALPVVSDDGVVPVQAVSAIPQGAAEPRDQMVPGTASSPVDENLPPGEYLDRAQQEYEAGRVATALAILDQFREHYPSGSDEAWWLYGQFYEASGPSRDVRTALDYYRRLVQEYPQSRRYDEARRRIAYLERYYINIR